MHYRVRDTTAPAEPVERITDEELHPLIDSEIQKVPAIFGVYILCEGNTPIHVGYGQLEVEMLMARSRHPKATRFALRFGHSDEPSATQLTELLRKEYGLTSKGPIGFKP